MRIDRSRPYLLKIGEYCKITAGTTILTHDYSRSVLRRTYGEVVGEGAETVIGDNVFVGMHSIILMGAHIGNNVIVGAGSVVCGNIPNDVVIAGNPARVIRTLKEHYEIKKGKSIEQARDCFRNFKRFYGRQPTIKEMDPFWPLFLERDREVLRASGVRTKLNGDEEEDVIRDFLKTKPVFGSWEEFVAFCEDEELS